VPVDRLSWHAWGWLTHHAQAPRYLEKGNVTVPEAMRAGQRRSWQMSLS